MRLFFLFSPGSLLEVILYNIYEVLMDLQNKLIFLLAVDDSHGVVTTAQHYRLRKRRLAHLEWRTVVCHGLVCLLMAYISRLCDRADSCQQWREGAKHRGSWMGWGQIPVRSGGGGAWICTIERWGKKAKIKCGCSRKLPIWTDQERTWSLWWHLGQIQQRVTGRSLWTGPAAFRAWSSGPAPARSNCVKLGILSWMNRVVSRSYLPWI